MAKTKILRARITDEEQELIIKYCEKNNISRSNLVRFALVDKIVAEMKKEEKENEPTE